jgi:nicotinamidase-related amidase
MKNKVTIIFFIFMLVMGFSLNLKSKKKSDFVFDQHTALLLIDIQNFYFPQGKVPLKESELACQKAEKILEFFRQKNLLIVHIKHMPKTVSKTDTKKDPQWNIHPRVFPLKAEKVIVKHYASSFRETGLNDFLKGRSIQKLVVCGMQTHMCLEAGVRAAVDLGFSVTVVHDACATRDLEFNDMQIPAHLVHASTLATLKSAYARVVSSDELMAEQKEEK